MEKELANTLITLGTIYGAAIGLQETTVGRQCAADARFFSRIRGGRTFTVKKFDDVVLWFSHNWPEKAVWPENIIRPSVAEVVQ